MSNKINLEDVNVNELKNGMEVFYMGRSSRTCKKAALTIEEGRLYVCTNDVNLNGGIAYSRFGYKYSWYIGEIMDEQFLRLSDEDTSEFKSLFILKENESILPWL